MVLSPTFTTGAAIRTNLAFDAVKSFGPVAMPFEQFIARKIERWKKVAKAADVKPE